jgi:DNA-binding response OmpR family regulator
VADSAAPAHVILVEDSELVAGAFAILFESAGHRLSTATSIAAAIEIGRADPAALVLLDLTLPDGDGLTLIEPMRTTGSKQFVALTGRDDPVTRRRCLEAGCIEVLIKPVPARELMGRVGGWVTAGA